MENQNIKPPQTPTPLITPVTPATPPAPAIPQVIPAVPIVPESMNVKPTNHKPWGWIAGITIIIVIIVIISAIALYNKNKAGKFNTAQQLSTTNQQVTTPPVADTTRAPIKYIKQTIQDPAANNVDALTYLIPEGWQSQSSVQWMHDWRRLAYLQTHIDDPKTGISMDWLPIQDFIYFTPPAGFNTPVGGNYMGKMYLSPITDPVQFITQFWMPNTLPELQSATLVNTKEVPIIADEFKKQFGGPADVHAYKMRYEYQQGGRTWEEDVQFALLFSSANGITSWYVNFALATKAPKGELDRNEGIISTIVASRTTTTEWAATYQLVQNLFTRGLQQQMADTVAFGQVLAQNRAESQALQQQITADRLSSQDSNAEIFRQTLGGVESYNDPVNNGVVELPLGWNQYWVNQQGEYLTSDNVNFDPNTLNDGSWQQLQKLNP